MLLVPAAGASISSSLKAAFQIPESRWMAHERLQNCLDIRACHYPISTLFSLGSLLPFTIDCSSVPGTSSGEPTNTMIRWRRFLFSRCFRASWETAKVVWTSISSDLASSNMNIEDNLTQILRMSNKYLSTVIVKKIRSYHITNQRWKLTHPFHAIVIKPTVQWEISAFESILFGRKVFGSVGLSNCAWNLVG